MNPARILVVDDNPTNLKLLLELLELEGHEARHAADAESALGTIADWLPDLILMDLGLPGMDGLTLTRKLKADPATRQIVIAAVTASAMKGDHEKALRAGCDAYFTKPIDTRALPGQIANLLGRSAPARPAATTPASAAPETATRARPVSGGRSVLVVDDIAANRLLLRGILEAADFRVTEAADGVEALAALQNLHMDAVISDVLMPNMDGFRLCLEVRKLPAFARLPFVIYTSTYNSPADRVLATKAGADCYLVKPAPAATVVATLLEAIAKAAERPAGVRPEAADESDVLKRYNSALVAKLEEKNAELEAAITQANEREARFRQLADNISQIFSLTDPLNNTVLYISPAYEAIWGRSCASMLASPADWMEAILSEDRPRVLAATLTKKMAGTYDEQYRIARPDGTVRWIHDRAFPVRDTSGIVIRLAGLAEDITSRKQIEQRLLEQAQLLDLARDSISVLNLEDHIQYWNEGSTRLYGHTTAEAIGRPVLDVVRPDPLAFRKAKASVLTAGEWTGELKHTHKSGAPITVDSRWTLVRDEHSHPKSILVINTDITERKKLEANVLRAQRVEAVGMLASGVAHDLNNMLAPIMMAVPLLRMDLPGTDRAKMLATVEISVQRGASLVARLLTFGRGVEGERRHLKPAQLVHEIARIAEDTFPKNISIEDESAPDVWPIRADVTQLNQVLLNLCVNARDAMPNGGRLAVGADNVELDENAARMTPGASARRYVVIRVSDNGTGIPPEIMDKIFDPFFTTKEVGKGTGLGLAMVAGIIKNHGGFLTVKSQPGQGTAFLVHLPATTEDESNVASPRASPPPRGNGELILLVDDEEGIRETVRHTLAHHGYQVLTAVDGAAGTAVYASRPDIRVVITDLEMPVMDGVMMIRVLRRINPKLKVLVSSGATSSSTLKRRRAELSALGIDSILVKPYDAAKILGEVHRLL
jgi:PAS domain S-box-containing protein